MFKNPQNLLPSILQKRALHAGTDGCKSTPCQPNSNANLKQKSNENVCSNECARQRLWCDHIHSTLNEQYGNEDTDGDQRATCKNYQGIVSTSNKLTHQCWS